MIRTSVTVLLLLGFATAGAVVWWQSRDRVTTDNAFVDGDVAYVSAHIDGSVTDVLVDDNEHVVAGSVLVRLDPRATEARVARLEAELDTARNRLEEARATVEALEAEREIAAVELSRAAQELRRLQQLRNSGVVSARELEVATADRDRARARIRAIERRRDAERALLRDEAPIHSAEAALREAQVDLSEMEIVAPFSGTVGRRSVQIGETVARGRPLLALASDDETWVIANFKETQIGRMHAGNRAEIRVDAFPRYVWHGHVESISPATGATFSLIPPDNASGNFTKVVQRVPVRIAIDRREPPVTPSEQNGARQPLSVHLPVGLSVAVRVFLD